MRRFVNNEAVNAIFERSIVVQFKLTFIVLVAGDIDSRSINDVTLVPFTIVASTGSSSSWHCKDEEWHKVTIAINHVLIDLVRSCSSRLSKDDSTWCTARPPGVAVNNILSDRDIVRSISSDSTTREVTHVVPLNHNIC